MASGQEGDFALSYFGEADLSRSDFRKARFQGARFEKAKVLQAAFMDSDCYNCDMSHADLTGSDFSRANLFLACMHGVKDKDAHFEGANKLYLRGPDADMAAAESFRAPE